MLFHLTRVAEQPLHRALGLTNGEYDRICELLTREPNHFELAVFSLLWSEHCGYKHSARLLKRLPSTGERVLQGPGENAGVIDLGDGEAVAFKVESHNHPSAVEPFQGAATGVGGILRDIVAMGARPVALLDGLRFGAPDNHFDRAVAGIGAYGNSTGIPTVGGEAVFDPSYADNCLVNAMCVGLLPVGAADDGEGDRGRPPRRPLRRDDRPRRDRRRERAREPGARRERRRQAALGAGRRPVHRQEADRGLGRADRARARRVAAGLRRRGPRVLARRDGRRVRARHPPRPRAAARGGDGAVGDHDLREPGADGRGRPPADARGGGRGLRALGAALHHDRRGDRLRAPARLPRRRDGRLDPGAAAHRRVPALRHPAAAAPRGEGDAAVGPGQREGAARPARLARTSAAAPGSTSATTTSSARAPCGGRGSTPPSCACARRCAGSRSRSTARGGSRRSTRAPAARSPCSRPRATSPAPAGSRWR